MFNAKTIDSILWKLSTGARDSVANDTDHEVLEICDKIGSRRNFVERLFYRMLSITFFFIDDLVLHLPIGWEYGSIAVGVRIVGLVFITMERLYSSSPRS